MPNCSVALQCFFNSALLKILIFFLRFKEYVEPNKPYNFSKQFLYVMLFRMVFVIVFQYLVFFVKDTLSWLVPDEPSSLQAKIRRKLHVARMCFRKSAVEAIRESSARQRKHRTSNKTVCDKKLSYSENKAKFTRASNGKKPEQHYIEPDVYFHQMSYV